MIEYHLNPIGRTQAETLRQQGGPVSIVDAKPGYPCRQCLRDAEVGEEVLLTSFDPFEKDSPYRSASPIYLHVADCGAPDHLALPIEQLAIRKLSLRAFDDAAMMIAGLLAEGEALEQSLGSLFSNPVVERVHIHNAGPGCWALAARRS